MRKVFISLLFAIFAMVGTVTDSVFLTGCNNSQNVGGGNLEAYGNLIVGTENDSYASGNCMTIQYDASTKIYTLTNTAATDDP